MSIETSDGTRLDTLVELWRARGAALPVAVVVSVFDDLLETEPNGRGRSLALGDIAIDHHGMARPAHDPSLAGLGPLLYETLGPDGVPDRAQALLQRLTSEDPAERPVDAEQFRQWLREALGASVEPDSTSPFTSIIVLRK